MKTATDRSANRAHRRIRDCRVATAEIMLILPLEVLMHSQSNSIPAPVVSIDGLRMSSREIAELTGKRHDHVKRDIEKLLADLGEDIPKFGAIYLDSMNREQTEYLLDRDHTENLLMGYSPVLRRAVLTRMREMEAMLAEPRMPTTAEAFASAFRMLADAERRDAEREHRLNNLDERVEKVEAAQIVLPARPANAESIVHLRTRIGKAFGLSAETVDAVMRQSPYAPKPAGMVRNDRAEADGATYAVYWKKDVTATFDRFVNECSQISPKFWKHPFIDGKFQRVKGSAA